MPPEIAEAVKAGNEALEQKRWADGIAAFEMVLPIAPDKVGLRTALDHVPQGSVTDPNVFINVRVLFMNQKKSDEAETYFTKAIEVAPGQLDGYDYRGLARIGLQNNEEARADFLKVVELAPKDSTEVKEAQQLLEALKGSRK